MVRQRITAALRRSFRRSAAPAAQTPQPSPWTRAAVEAVLDEWVRPAIAADGGRIDVVRLDGADVYVRLGGACRGCSAQQTTLQDGVARMLRDELPGFGTLHAVGDL